MNDHVPSRDDLATTWPDLAAVAIDALDTLVLDVRLNRSALGAAEAALADRLMALQTDLIDVVDVMGRLLAAESLTGDKV